MNGTNATQKRTIPIYKQIRPYDGQDNKKELRDAVNKVNNGVTGFLSDEEPDLEFITDGTKTITEGIGILAMFCPHDEYCPKSDVDVNCFYEKFLHCIEARQLELIHQLGQIDRYYLRYRKQVLSGELPISTQKGIKE